METIPFKRENTFYYCNYLHLPEVQKEAIENKDIRIDVKYLTKFTVENLDKYISSHKPDNAELNALRYMVAEMGNLELLQYLLKFESDKCFDYTMNHAIKSNKLEVVKFLYERGFKLDIIDVIKFGDLEIVKFAIDVYNVDIGTIAMMHNDKTNEVNHIKEKLLLKVAERGCFRHC